MIEKIDRKLVLKATIAELHDIAKEGLHIAGQRAAGIDEVVDWSALNRLVAKECRKLIKILKEQK